VPKIIAIFDPKCKEAFKIEDRDDGGTGSMWTQEKEGNGKMQEWPQRGVIKPSLDQAAVPRFYQLLRRPCMKICSLPSCSFARHVLNAKT